MHPSTIQKIKIAQLKKSNIVNLNNWPALISRSIQLNDIGNGIYIINLVFLKKIKESDSNIYIDSQIFTKLNILEVLNLAENSEKNDKRLYKISVLDDNLDSKLNSYTLQEIAFFDIINLKNEINKVLYSNILLLENSSRNNLTNIYSPDRKLVQEDYKKSSVLFEQTFLSFNRKKIYYPQQNPYIYIEIETEDLTSYFELISKDHESCGKACLHGILQDILIRVGPTGLDYWGVNKDYLYRHGADKYTTHFPNLYPINYLIIYCHFRSSLALLPPVNIKETEGLGEIVDKYLIASRDTINLVRLKWYYLVTEHTYIDFLMEYLEQHWNFRKGFIQEYLKVQKLLLNIRFNIGKALVTPLVYKRAASSLNELYFNLERIFKIDGIQKNLLNKLENTLDIYEECLNIASSERTT